MEKLSSWDGKVGEKRSVYGEDLRKEPANLMGLINVLPAMVYRCLNDSDWTMLFVNEGAFDLTGYHPEDLIGNKTISYAKLIHPADRGKVRNEILVNAIAGKHFSLEYRILSAQGKEKWVREQGKCGRDALGRSIIEGFIIDITCQKQAEQQMAYLSFHDVLTGLYNRVFFQEELCRMDTERQLPLSIVMVDLNGLKLVNDAFGHHQGDELLRSTADILRRCCRREDVISRWGGDEFVILMPKTTNETAMQVCQRIKQAAGYFSHSFLQLGISVGVATKDSIGQEVNDVYHEAESSMYRNKILEGKNSRSVVLTSLKKALSHKNYKMESRAAEVKNLMVKFGWALGLDRSHIDDLELLAAVCDMGKLCIDDKILRKPGALTEAEWDIIRKHPETGCRIARTLPELVSVAEAVLSHHERWDGTGYPQKLKGEEIPLLSRIVAIVHAYDAMTHPRPYAKTLAPGEALAEIQWCAGTQFDPHLADIFVGLMRKRNLNKRH